MALVKFEDCTVVGRNFSGGRFKGGDRSFCLVLEDEVVVDQLARDGWNIRERDTDDGDKIYYLPVAIRFDKFPPEVFVILENGRKIEITEDNESFLDKLDDNLRVTSVDCVVNGSKWTDDDGNVKVKAWLRTGYFTVASTDPFAEKHGKYDD